MALNKTIVNERGITTNYHKIGTVVVDKTNTQIIEDGEVATEQARYNLSFSVESFVSAEIRQKSERLMADRRPFTAICTIDELASTPLMTLCYSKLKEDAAFAGAEDC